MKFSIIIPVYNKANTLEASIRSVLKQTNRDFEIIIVNDGSTDNFTQIAEEYVKYQKVHIINQENEGVSVARNNGIRNAQGDFICFLDADDLYFDTHLEILDRLINKYPNNSCFVTSHVTIFADKTQKESNQLLNDYPIDFICDNLFRLLNKRGDGIINTNCVRIKRELLFREDIFFEPKEKIGEDTDMWFRIALRHPIVISKETTTSYLREFSTATAKTSNSLTWIFAKRNIKELHISYEVKKECLKLVDRYRMTCSRDYLKEFNRELALLTLKSVEYKVLKYYVSMFLCYLPYKLSRWLINHI